ncbi:MAG TPA: hypothetical protein VK501_12760 [Baekduia sp.]|nr:hypothetical protein [Baekduia sp.]
MSTILPFLAAIDVKVTSVADAHRDTVDYLTLVFAFLAAVGTISAVIVALWQAAGSRRRVARLKTGLTKDGVGIYVTNNGSRPFTVESVHFVAANGASMWPRTIAETRDTWPKHLSEGETAQFVFERGQPPLADDRRPELVVVRSTGGDEWLCFYNPFKNLSTPRRLWLDTFGQIAAEVVRRAMPLGL